MKGCAVILVFCLLAFVTALNEDQSNKLKEHKKACIQETGASTEKVNDALGGKLDESDEKLGCFFACLFKRIGILNADGTFNEEVTRSKIPADVDREKAEATITDCKNFESKDHCNIGKELYKCYMKHKSSKFTIF